MNNVADALDKTKIQHVFYADDLQIYVQVPKSRLDEVMKLLEKAAAVVADWTARCSFRLNASKNGLPAILMSDSERVPLSDSVTSIELVLDSKLSWKLHIDASIKKFNIVLCGLS